MSTGADDAKEIIRVKRIAFYRFSSREFGLMSLI